MNRASRELDPRAAELFSENEFELHARTDRLFSRLLVAEWLGAIAIAFWVSPRTWEGATSAPHIHVYGAVIFGAVIILFPVLLALRFPGRRLTRHSIAIGQMSLTALMIHLTGGRLETHFMIFGSLAFLAFYRDWRVLITASVIVAIDHIVRGAYWPQSLFGVLAVNQWRWVEHAAWVVFEDIFLIPSCLQARAEMREIALRRSAQEAALGSIEVQVDERTEELLASYQSLAGEVEQRMRARSVRDTVREQLAHSQKLEAVGQLAAGIAHEINTPTQYVGDNTRFLQESFGELRSVLEAYKRVVSEAQAGRVTPEALEQVVDLVEDVDLEYLDEEIPKAIQQSLEGIGRVSRIVRAMKEFSHPGVDDMTPININAAIESTTIVCANEWKYIAALELDLDQSLPLVPCLPGEINQVLLNLIVNAAHAIDETRKGDTETRGKICVRSRAVGEQVEIRIEDSGSGMPEKVRARIFEPFFTTKGVGKGTGQGLAIAHNVIVNKHHGVIDVETQEGAGTTFVIRLPLSQAMTAEAAA